MKGFFSSLLSLALTLAVLGGVIALDRAIPPGENDYVVREFNGQTYLCFDVPYTGSRDTVVGCIVYPTFLMLDSVWEIRDKIRDHSFTDEEYHTIRAFFPYDEYGVPILDLDDLREANLPDGFESVRLEWYGKFYEYSGWIKEDGKYTVVLSLYYRSSKDMERYYDYYQTGYDNDYFTLTGTSYEEERDADVRYYLRADGSETTDKVVHYRLPDGTYAEERYYGTAAIERAVPSEVFLYHVSDDINYYVYMYGLTERPSVEWLSEIYLK